MKMYDFFRSGSSHRLRIALNIKGQPYEQIAVNLRTEEHLRTEYARINPQQFVPTLVDGERVLVQSPAIIEWLEERFPSPALLPSDPYDRAHVRSLAALIGCDIHPLNNRRVLERLRKRFSADESAIAEWCAAWICPGLDAFDALVKSRAAPGPYAFGAQPTVADVYLIPQLESARRFGIDLSAWPRLVEIDGACGQLEPFQRAAPSRQADAK